jgi:hypothetical protein
MKRIIVLLIIFVPGIISSFGQAPDWSWVKRSYGAPTNPGVDGYGNEAYSMAADIYGNVYVTGYYLSPTIIFDDDTLTNSSDAYEIFLVKYDNDGNVLWARSVGGDDNDSPVSVAADIHGGVYIAGYFRSPEIVIGNDTVFNNGFNDVLLCKFDANGNYLWVRSAKGTSEDVATSVAVDKYDNVYLTGLFFSSQIVFGSDTLINKGSSDIFVIKYRSDGNIAWAEKYGENGEEKASSIAADKDGNIFVGGLFKGSFITFSSDTFYNAYTGGYSDIFLTKFDSTGIVLWAKSAGALSDERIYAITVDNSGNLYAAGVFFSPTFTIDTTTLVNTFILRGDFFIAKYTTNGLLIWAKSGGGNQYDAPASIASDANGNVTVSICYNSSSFIIGSDTIFNAGLFDGAVVKYDMNGNLLWMKDIGGIKDDGAFAVAVNSFQNIFVAGYYQSPSVVFDSFILTSPDTNFSTVFVASIEDIITEVKNNTKQELISVYPNPCNGIFTVKISSMDNDDVLFVYNIFGDKIYSRKNLSCIEQIDLLGYAKGMYLIKLQSEKGFCIAKVLIE